MKRPGIHLLSLIIALVSMTALIAIQVNWVIKEAQLQEKQFNDNVKTALTNIEESLAFISGKEKSDGFYRSCPIVLRALQQAIDLDSLISNELKSSGINLDYEYGIVNFNLANYHQSLKKNEVTANLAAGLKESGYQLNINFPSRSDFFFAQISSAFITSIVLIILTIVSFIFIFSYYRRERSLSRQIRDFVNNMTHEFKTPLTNIAFANSMMSKNNKISEDEKLSSYVGIINTEQKRLTDRVEKLLGTAREPLAGETELEDIDLPEIVGDVILAFQEQVDLQGGEISLHSSGNDFTLHCNPDSVIIILNNLIDNALKYNSNTPRVEVHIADAGKKLLLEVRDNGIGIPREMREDIFKQYFRVSTGDRHDIKGFGIGLYHVKNILDQMGGKISVQSGKNKGTTFIVQLPKKPL